jgi:gliding motility-associated-like protein
MKPFLLLIFTGVLLFVVSNKSFAQLQVTNSNNAIALAQKIAGEGVIVSNATLTGGSASKGFFINRGGTQINLDSGIVLTSGRAETSGALNGINITSFQPASSVLANNTAGTPGDADLALALGVPTTSTRDACVLEFDFIPVGDTIKFNYVFSSEEYNPSFVCSFNDAFAFFISGPGITGLKNIALVPGTTTPVSIFNVNNVKNPPTILCPNNPQYYIDNRSNTFFSHDGHTTVLTAVSEVQPCQTYHLKMVVVDLIDSQYDTGVFLEAGSLRSDPLKIEGHNPLNEFNLPYLAEGCVPGSIHVVRNRKKPYPQILTLTYAGTAINGVDVTLLPPTATILANDSVVIIPITAIADLIPEGNEKLKIYIGNNCASIYSDSIEIEIRDIDLLAITPADSMRICRNASVQLDAPPGYLTYTWTNGGTLSINNINNPVATPTGASTNYICTATIGNCTARDSVLLNWKTVSLVSKTDILCKNGTNGAISINGTGWGTGINYAINNGAFQAGNTFPGLTAGTYWLKIKDDSGCTDSIQVTLVQSFPDIAITANPVAATCSITPDGTISVAAAGGNGLYTYSSNGTSYQNNNVLTVAEGSYTVYVKDGNGCSERITAVVVPKINSVVVDAEPDTDICEGTSYKITAISNVTDISWSPTIALANTTTLTPTASPVDTTKYYVTATFGTCTRTDSVIINVWPAPIPDAGDDLPICYGITAQLHGAGGLQFQWTADASFVSPTDISSPTVKPAITTTYYLNVKDVHGCVSLQKDDVTIHVTPSVKIFAGNDTIIAINQPLKLNAVDVNRSGVDHWEWSSVTTVSNLDNPMSQSPVATFSSPVAIAPYEYVYTITGRTPVGCEGFDEIKIKVYKGPDIYVPTGFTPNSDGKNDLLIPVPVGIKDLKFFRVFNRWGQLIFQTQNPSRGWDGRINGVTQPTGVFIWTAEGIDYTGKLISVRGTSTLVR